MAHESTMPPEETLDPEDWEAMRALGHRMLDDMLDYMQTVRERPVWQHAPDQVKANFDKPVPLEPQPPEDWEDSPDSDPDSGSSEPETETTGSIGGPASEH